MTDDRDTDELPAVVQLTPDVLDWQAQEISRRLGRSENWLPGFMLGIGVGLIVGTGAMLWVSLGLFR